MTAGKQLRKPPNQTDFFAKMANRKPTNERWWGGHSVGVPGVVAMLEKAHRNHGHAPWSGLFSPSIKLAQEGFRVSPRLRNILRNERHLHKYSTSRHYFYKPDGSPNDRLINLPLAKTLQQVAKKGAEVFYQGPLAQAIVETVKRADPPGDLSLADIKSYRAKERQPICSPYRTKTVCSMPPPTSGGIAILQMLSMLETFDVSKIEPGSVEMIHLFTQAQRLAFADRDRYVADTDFVDVPVAALLDKTYLQGRAKAIRLDRDMGEALPGNPQGVVSSNWQDSNDISLPSTSHISIVDGWGNAVSMTTSVENAFGSRLMVEGFFLNNQLTDFSFVPKQNGKLVANRVEPGKRPRSSMTMVMIFDEAGNLQMVAGSPGGSQIIGYVGRTIWTLLEWNLDPQKVVDMANFGNRNGVTELEEDHPEQEEETFKKSLEALGHHVKISSMNSGLNVITIDQNGLYGGTDFRREGIVMGD